MRQQRFVAFLAFLALAAGCAGPKQTLVASNEPDWVRKGTGAFKDSGGSVFYGVGSAAGIRNPSLAYEAANTRSCGDIAQTLNRYVTKLTKSYMASTTAGAMDKSSEEQHVTDTLKQFTKFTLTGASPVDHWKDPSGTVWALCKLDMATMKKSLEDAKELDAKVRDYVRANAEKSFDDLAAEEAKH